MTAHIACSALVYVLATLVACGATHTPASQPVRPAQPLTSAGALTGQNAPPPGSNLQDMLDLYAVKRQIARIQWNESHRSTPEQARARYTGNGPGTGSDGRLFKTRRGARGRYVPTSGRALSNNAFTRVCRKSRELALTQVEKRSPLERFRTICVMRPCHSG
jgi:hypothetical protein